MFSLKIVDTDMFLDMSKDAQLLYFHLSMRADDEGFVSNPRKIMRMIGSSDDDIKLLVIKNFIIPFDSGICVIKDWKIHNYIQKDRFEDTQFLSEKESLIEDENGSYKLMDTKCIQNVSNLDTQVRIGKDRIGKDSIEATAPSSKRFIKPTLEEIKAYCDERNNSISPNMFYDFYESKGWKVGKEGMKDWKSAIRTWEQRENNNKSKPAGSIDLRTKK